MFLALENVINSVEIYLSLSLSIMKKKSIQTIMDSIYWKLHGIDFLSRIEIGFSTALI